GSKKNIALLSTQPNSEPEAKMPGSGVGGWHRLIQCGARGGPMAEDERAGASTALVTGGSRGIGLAVVTALAEAGWRVWFCARSADSTASAQAELARFGAAVSGRQVDVRRQEAVDAWVREVLEQAGRIDCLVNNAGLGIFGPADSLTGEQWREV